MYTLEREQAVPFTAYVVWQAGTYEANDLVLCGLPGDSRPTVQFLAVYIATGGYGEN